MSIYDKRKMGEILTGNDYQGRGIVIGTTPDGKYAAIAYFIMGRSENSRNRVFSEEGDDVIIYPYDEDKVEDPSLIIYAPVRTIDNKLIVTNGDQTDTVRDFV
ncbi:MAG: inosine monophosphate cyclohydrolase, partial [Firmicutes bacterium]|nr:inosine monophosphate cyclohydrolase [Bacillota bacterium]